MSSLLSTIIPGVLRRHLGRDTEGLPTPAALMQQLVESGAVDAANGDAIDALVNNRVLSAVRELDERHLALEHRLERRDSRLLPFIIAAQTRATARRNTFQQACTARQEAAAAMGDIVEEPQNSVRFPDDAHHPHSGYTSDGALKDFPEALRARLATDLAPLPGTQAAAGTPPADQAPEHPGPEPTGPVQAGLEEPTPEPEGELS